MKKTLSLLAILLLTIYSANAEMVQAFEMQTNKASGSTINLGFVAGGTQTVGVDWGDGTIVTFTGISNSINAPTNTSGVTTVDQAIIKVYVDGSSITNLVCTGNGLTSLDLSRTNSLTRLTVSNNNLTTLDVSNQTNLQQLMSIGGNNKCFKGIDLSNNAVLNTLTIRNGGLEFAKELDFSATNITNLSIQNDGPVNASSLSACALDSIYRMLPDRTGKPLGTIFVGNSAYVKTPDNDYNGSNKTLVDGKNWVVKTTTNNAILTGDGAGCTSTDNLSIELSNFNIYPNPTSNYLTITSKDNVINTYAQIFDLSGKKVIEKRINKEVSNIDISSLKVGVYTIKVGDDIQKFIVK